MARTDRPRPRLRRAAGFTLLACLALLALACGRDAEARTLSESSARLVADEALLREDELPEARWRVVPEGAMDAGAEELSPNELFANPACRPLRAFFEHAGVEGAQPGAGIAIAWAERSFESTEGAFTIRFVRSAVAVYATEEEAAEAGEALRESLAIEALRDCLGEGLVGLEQDGVEITRVDLSGPGASINGGTGVTLDIEIFALFFTVDLQVHVYTFQRQHAVASLVTLELNSDLLEQEQQTLLEAFAARVSRAHEGK